MLYTFLPYRADKVDITSTSSMICRFKTLFRAYKCPNVFFEQTFLMKKNRSNVLFSFFSNYNVFLCRRVCWSAYLQVMFQPLSGKSVSNFSYVLILHSYKCSFLSHPFIPTTMVSMHIHTLLYVVSRYTYCLPKMFHFQIAMSMEPGCLVAGLLL